MADRLTQLQDCLDQLATQMYASLRYIQTRHSYAVIEGQPDMNPFPTADQNNPSGTQGSPPPANAENGAKADEAPDAPEVFEAALQELARDLVAKEQQIESIIDVLPGIDTSEQAQNERMRELEAELSLVDAEREAAVKEKEKLMERLDGAIARIQRI